MPWLDTPVDGQQSVSANKPRINNNHQYISDEMKKDHFWDNANSNLDGRHQFVQMPKNEAGGNPANPAIATDLDGVYFVKDKTSADAPDGQHAEPHYIMNDGSNNQVLQLGFRALAHFEVSGGTVTEKYIHNCSISRTSTGNFTLTFDTAVPTANYIVSGSAMRDSGPGLAVVLKEGTKAANMTTTNVLFQTRSTNSGNVRDPIVCTIMIAGG